MLENLSKYIILLASKSPRRKELLSQLRIPFNTVVLGGIDESYPAGIKTEHVPEYIACKKAEAYIQKFHDNELIITADTLVILGDHILGKPQNDKEAFEMISNLSGKVHKVITGVSVSSKEKSITFSDITEVKFTNLTNKEIEYYVNNFQPLDKAGSYGIQEWIGCVGVEWIKGSYYNVMGLPLHKLYEHLKNF